MDPESTEPIVGSPDVDPVPRLLFARQEFTRILNDHGGVYHMQWARVARAA